jgi:hypothetical protein
MASLTFYKEGRRRETEFAHSPSKEGDEAMDLKGSKVMAVRLETGRSSPG